MIRTKIAPNISYVHEISELLGISYDSAYRRIRGEKELTFNEIQILSKEFDISLDTVLNVTKNNLSFKYFPVESNKLHMADWLNIILQDLKRIKAANQKEIIYGAKDPPIFHYFQFPEIAAFKMFFWEKTLFQFPEHEEKLFSIEDYNSDIKEVGEKILAVANTLPTSEIWNQDTFNIILRQIEYYWVSGLFKNKDDIHILCERLEQWIRHIQKQAELGMKFIYGTPPEGIPDSYKIYENEVVLNDNTIFVCIDGIKYTYLTYNVASLLVTSEPQFCESVEQFFHGLMKKSMLISSVGDKERNRFFNRLVQNIEKFKDKVGLNK